jgi:Domain of unknown function (DUF6268)
MTKSRAIAILFCGLVPSASSQPLLSGWDPSGGALGYAGQMAFDRTPGNLEIMNFRIHTLLSNPFPSADGWMIRPVFDCDTTTLRFNDVPTSLPVDPGNLESFDVHASMLSFSTFALSSVDSSPWVLGGWGRVQLASDFQEVDSDDFTFDVASGIGYRFSDQLTLGLGALVTDLNVNQRLRPGIGLDWDISEHVRATALGTGWRLSYTPDEIWQISLRGEEMGEIWNIQDDARKSRSIDLRSYRIGVFINHRLSERLEIRIGAGAALTNEISLTSPGGRVLLRQGTDDGAFAEVGLTVTSW